MLFGESFKRFQLALFLSVIVCFHAFFNEVFAVYQSVVVYYSEFATDGRDCFPSAGFCGNAVIKCRQSILPSGYARNYFLEGLCSVALYAVGFGGYDCASGDFVVRGKSQI